MAATAEKARVPRARADQLKITEIFHSVQGESASLGWPTVFVRLTGCPLRCHYCDTAYAFHGGRWMSFDDIVSEVGRYHCRHVCVTGGEPLAQKRCTVLLERLCDAGHEVSLETSGAVDVAGVDSRVVKVLDLKTPASGESGRNRWENLEHLQPHDQIKFVVCNRADYEWAREVVAEKRLSGRWQVFFSPSHEQLAPATLADWILEDRLPVRFQVQLHKYVWGNVPGK